MGGLGQLRPLTCVYPCVRGEWAVLSSQEVGGPWEGGPLPFDSSRAIKCKLRHWTSGAPILPCKRSRRGRPCRRETRPHQGPRTGVRVCEQEWA